MKIQLFEKKYYKTKDDDGTSKIDLNWLNSKSVKQAYNETKSYKKDDYGETLETITTKTLDLASIKKEFPQCVKVKIGDLYIKL